MIWRLTDGRRVALAWQPACLWLMQAIWRPGAWLADTLFGGEFAHSAGLRLVEWWPLRRPVLVILREEGGDHA